MDWLNNLATFLKQKMKDNKLTILQLSKLAGVPLTTLRKICDCERHPRMENILKLADFFECSIDEMLGLSDPSPTEQQYTKLTLEEMESNLRNFINTLLETNNMTLYQLGVKIGCSEDAFRAFLKKGGKS